MMRRRRLLAAFGVSGAAGCLRLSGDSDGNESAGDGTSAPIATTGSGRTTASGNPSTPTSTATDEQPDPTTTEETTEGTEEATYPIGLSEDGVDQFLYGQHTRTLETRSFRTSWEKLNRSDDFVPHAKSYRVDNGVAVGEWVRPDRGGQVDMYREGNTGLWREDVDGEYIYGKDDAGFDWNKLGWDVEVRPLLSALDWGTPERVNDGQSALWELRATEIADPSATVGYTRDDTIQSLAEAVLRVNDDGVIRRLRAIYSREDPEGDDVFETRYEVTDIGDVSVSRPSWVETAREQRPTVRAEYQDDRQFVALTIESGSRIAAGSRIVLSPESGTSNRFKINIQSSLNPGTTAYLWREQSDSNDAMRISRGSRPAEASPVQLNQEHRVAAYRRTSTYFVDVGVQ